jgi:hypothetical protein
MAGVGRGEGPSIAAAKQAVDKIVKHIENKFTAFNISEIIKAGSLGDGTAVPGDYDIDLVVYSRDFTGLDVLSSGSMFRPWIAQLKAFIKQARGVTLYYRGERAENFSVQFSYEMSPGVSIDVDLLVSPYWNYPQNFYEFLRSVPPGDRIKYSVCASKWQREFFRRQENQVVKEYIRRAKAWRNREWGSSRDGKPKSYLMSLLVVRAFENAPKSDPHSVTQALKALVKNESKDVYWADSPNSFYKRSEYKEFLPARPRVIDPANPVNNVWVTGFYSGGHRILVSKIHSIDLSKKLD